jgi:hypothetical protein
MIDRDARLAIGGPELGNTQTTLARRRRLKYRRQRFERSSVRARANETCNF